MKPFLSLRFQSLVVTLLSCLVLTTACKKSGSGSDVDPRDQYVGTYDGGYQASTLINNSLESSRESGTLVINVTKSQVDNQLYLALTFNNTTKQNLTAELSGASFTIIDKQKETIAFDGKSYDANYSATGQFVTNTIAINTTAETLQAGITITRRGGLTGTKK
ncbi:hypothetical protein GCM10027578_24580 [Spirosoma luteolum]